MTAAKGFVCNDETPANVAALKPQWLHIEWGEWCYDLTNVLPCDWVIHLYGNLPAVADLRRATQHPNYSGQFILGKNEPDLVPNWTPGQQFDLICQQMALVQQADPSARFAIEGGTQYHPIWQVNESGSPNSYFYKVWKKFTPQQQTAIRAIHFHYYVQAEIFALELKAAEFQSLSTVRERLAAHAKRKRKRAYDPHELANIFTPDPIINYFSQAQAAMVRLGIGSKKLWITEIGLVKNDFTLANLDKVAEYPNVIQQACDAVGVNRWALYSQSKNDGYHDLQDGSGSTPLGATFAAL